MNIFLKGLIVVFLASTTGLASSAKEVTVNQNELAQGQIKQVKAQVVSVLLPPLAQITLKGGGFKSGRLTVVDSQKQKLIITRGKASMSIPIANIEKVQFFQQGPDADGRLIPWIIKGERRTWSNIPLSNLIIRDAEKGKAEVSLPSGVDSRISKDRAAVYVIEELSFAADNKVTVGVIVAS
jgi:hypothetical protein